LLVSRGPSINLPIGGEAAFEEIARLAKRATIANGGLDPTLFTVFDRWAGSERIASLAIPHEFRPEDEKERVTDFIQPVVDKEQPRGFIFWSEVDVSPPNQDPQNAANDPSRMSGLTDAIIVVAKFRDFRKCILVLVEREGSGRVAGFLKEETIDFPEGGQYGIILGVSLEKPSVYRR
jgi:hypothetical protein